MPKQKGTKIMTQNTRKAGKVKPTKLARSLDFWVTKSHPCFFRGKIGLHELWSPIQYS